MRLETDQPPPVVHLHYVPQVLAPLFSLFAALQMGEAGDKRSRVFGLVAFDVSPGGAADRRRFERQPVSSGAAPPWARVPRRGIRREATLCDGVVTNPVAGDRRDGLPRAAFAKAGGSRGKRPAFKAVCPLRTRALPTSTPCTKTPECLCLTFAFGRAVSSGSLVPTNGYYRYFFAEPPPPRRLGQSGALRAECARAHPAAASKRRASSVLLDADTRLQSAPIRGGRVYSGGGYFRNTAESGTQLGGQRSSRRKTS